jgi:hypothetical protein
MQTKRGEFLTAMAILLALAVIIDVLKAFTKPPTPPYTLLGLKMLHRYRRPWSRVRPGRALQSWDCWWQRFCFSMRRNLAVATKNLI